MYFEMRFTAFALETSAGRPVVILKDLEEKRLLPVPVTLAEALSLAVELMALDAGVKEEGGVVSRILRHGGMEAASVLIEGSDACWLICSGEEKDPRIPVTAADAVLLSLKLGVPILVSEKFLAERPADTDTLSAEGVNAPDFLESLDPAAMGKYPM